jgi:hypothetical protein
MKKFSSFLLLLLVFVSYSACHRPEEGEWSASGGNQPVGTRNYDTFVNDQIDILQDHLELYGFHCPESYIVSEEAEQIADDLEYYLPLGMEKLLTDLVAANDYSNDFKNVAMTLYEDIMTTFHSDYASSFTLLALLESEQEDIENTSLTDLEKHTLITICRIEAEIVKHLFESGQYAIANGPGADSRDCPTLLECIGNGALSGGFAGGLLGGIALGGAGVGFGGLIGGLIGGIIGGIECECDEECPTATAIGVSPQTCTQFNFFSVGATGATSFSWTAPAGTPSSALTFTNSFSTSVTTSSNFNISVLPLCEGVPSGEGTVTRTFSRMGILNGTTILMMSNVLEESASVGMTYRYTVHGTAIKPALNSLAFSTSNNGEIVSSNYNTVFVKWNHEGNGTGTVSVTATSQCGANAKFASVTHPVED